MRKKELKRCLDEGIDVAVSDGKKTNAYRCRIVALGVPRIVTVDSWHRSTRDDGVLVRGLDERVPFGLKPGATLDWNGAHRGGRSTGRGVAPNQVRCTWEEYEKSAKAAQQKATNEENQQSRAEQAAARIPGASAHYRFGLRRGELGHYDGKVVIPVELAERLAELLESEDDDV